jgi:hypothetical protein
MRRWPNEARQSLRFLAAARYYLPAELQSPRVWEEEYGDCLRHGQFGHALELLERIGMQHAGCLDEATFWKELYFAARHLELPEHAGRYEARLRTALAGIDFAP